MKSDKCLCLKLTGNILSHTEFSLSAYRRNKRKMELAEKMEPGQTKRRRQSSENVSFVINESR